MLRTDNPPPIPLLVDCVEAIHAFVQADHRNVAAIHCKAGKGRTGVVVCCLLLRCGEHLRAADALRYYGTVRTSNGKGVTIASQQRYIGYFAQIVEHGVPRSVLASPTPRLLVGLRLHSTPKGGCGELFFKLEQEISYVDGKLRGKKWKSTQRQDNELRSSKEDRHYVLDVRCDQRLAGDVRLQCCEKQWRGSGKVFHCWFNTFFGKLLRPLLVALPQVQAFEPGGAAIAQSATTTSG